MTDEPRQGDDTSSVPPWERARRWNPERPEVTRVDELLARLGTPDQPTRRRRRRAEDDDDTTSVAAGDLIASLGGPAPDESTTVSPAAPPAPQPSAPDAPTEILRPPAVEGPDRADEPTQVSAAALDAPTEILPIYGTAAAEADAEAIRQSLNRTAADTGPRPAAAVIGPPTPPRTEAAPAPDHGGRRAALYAGRVLVTLLSVVVLAATGMYSVIISRGNAALAANEVQAVVTEDPNIVQPTAAAPSQDPTGPVLDNPENILLIGSDTRAGSNSDVGAGGEGAEGESANSDTMMIAHLSADRQRVQVLSLPRDLMVDAPDNCYGWDFRSGNVSDTIWDVSEGERWQINSAFSVGGPNCLVLAVQKFTGIRIDRVIGIDFVGFADMVDALGGIEVNICRPIDDSELGLIVGAPGVQMIGGTQALNLVRARKVPYDEGRSDPARIERQQKVLSTILRQVTAAGTLLDPGTLDGFLQAFAGSTQTDNVTLQEMVGLADSLGDLSPGKVTFYSLPTVPSDSRPGKLEADPVLAPAIFDAIINDQPLPSDEVQEPIVPESSAPAPSTPAAPAPTEPTPTTVTVDPSEVDVRVWNVAGRSGVAGDAQSALNDLGFDVTDDDLIRDDENLQDETTVVYAEADRATALTVLAAVPGATGVVDNSLSTGEIRLMVGADFDEVFADSVSVGDPVESATEATAEQPAPGTPSADDDGEPVESPILTSLAPSDVPAVNAGNTDCI